MHIHVMVEYFYQSGLMCMEDAAVALPHIHTRQAVPFSACTAAQRAV